MKTKINPIDGILLAAVFYGLGFITSELRKPTPITKYNAAVEYGWRCAKGGSTLKQALDEMKRP